MLIGSKIVEVQIKFDLPMTSKAPVYSCTVSRSLSSPCRRLRPCCTFWFFFQLRVFCQSLINLIFIHLVIESWNFEESCSNDCPKTTKYYGEDWGGLGCFRHHRRHDSHWSSCHVAHSKNCPQELTREILKRAHVKHAKSWTYAKLSGEYGKRDHV